MTIREGGRRITRVSFAPEGGRIDRRKKSPQWEGPPGRFSRSDFRNQPQPVVGREEKEVLGGQACAWLKVPSEKKKGETGHQKRDISQSRNSTWGASPSGGLCPGKGSMRVESAKGCDNRFEKA